MLLAFQSLYVVLTNKHKPIFTETVDNRQKKKTAWCLQRIKKNKERGKQQSLRSCTSL